MFSIEFLSFGHTHSRLTLHFLLFAVYAGHSSLSMAAEWNLDMTIALAEHALNVIPGHIPCSPRRL